MSSPLRLFVLVALAASLCGCPPSEGPVDAGAGDTGALDAPRTDGGGADGGGALDGGPCDEDGDGELSIACGGADCDDTDPDRSPTSTEVCDAADVDEDCDVTTFGEQDLDGDGHFDAECCNGSECGDDCDDATPGTHPTVPEVCDGIDNDCDTRTDEATSPVTWYRDADGDMFGNAAGGTTTSCEPVDGYSTLSTDCNDGNASVNPSAPEICNGVDDNCASGIDEGFGTVDYYPDCDGDDDGDESAAPVEGCAVPLTRPECGALVGNWVTNDDDCDDTRESAQPGASEICNGLDDDCDGVNDDGSAPTTWCNDPARDLHTTAASCVAGACAVVSCAAPHLDCSSSAGCETDGATSVTNCSACGNTCAWGACAGTCDPVELEAGYRFACARRASGAVYCWGFFSALGDGTMIGNRDRPGAAAIASGATQIAVSVSETTACALTRGGGVSCWGGVPSFGGTRYTPVSLTTSGALEVATSSFTVCWRTASNIQCTGLGTFAVTDAVELAVAGGAVCWRRSSGTVTCRPTSGVTADVPGLNAVSIAGGDASSFCAVRAGGGVTCWSVPSSGAITATDVAGTSDAIGVAVGGAHRCLWRANGTMACWGTNTDGAFGVATPASSTTPVEVPGLTDVLSVSTGLASTCARRRSGPFCWGDGMYGQIGNGTTTDSTLPRAVFPPP